MGTPIHYAKNGDVHIAYRVHESASDEPIDVLFVPIWTSNLDMYDSWAPVAQSLDELTRFARVIGVDRRGSGLSDRTHGIATLEEGMDDMLAVLDAVGSEQAALIGLNESGSLCAMLAATHPDRVSGLVLYGSFAATVRQDDYPWAPTKEERDEQIKVMIELWGSEDFAFVLNPTSQSDPAFREWSARWQRNSVTRDALPAAYDVLARTDVRHVLPLIRVPTLVLHRRDDPLVIIDNGRYLADKIPNAKMVELEGEDHIPFLGDWQTIVDEVEEFLTGRRPEREPDRVLATILFTDIVGSTQKATDLGDRKWKELLDRHDEILRSELARANGKLVKTVGDGALATFNGPARAIRAACRIRERVADLGLETRAGLHTGEVEIRGDDVGGIAVHIGARVAERAGPGELIVSSAIPSLVAGSGIPFEELEETELRGVEGRWRLYKALL
ncbi:MAG TPA: adenylate/guanylate cyclase domain-containing protein [Actinomycetota bacterium]|nr:adenylate/guanylate cyclase domain-containing protein [Actinomycetota bacterium]